MREYGFSLTRIFPYKDKIYNLRKNADQRNPYSHIFYAVFQTTIGPVIILPEYYQNFTKILPEVYSEPSQTSKM